MQTKIEISRTAVGVGAAGLVLSLLMSGWALAASPDDDEYRRSVEQRLVCLELPGPNDCGVDGR